MKLADIIILSLAVAFLIIGIHQIMTVGFASAYFVVMLALVMFFIFSSETKSEMNSEWLSAFVALLFSAIFSGVEIIFLSINLLATRAAGSLKILSQERSCSFSRRSALFFCTTLTRKFNLAGLSELLRDQRAAKTDT